ncbi:hypothetical protein [Longispora albida]|uniref:hypothetical protein n=1 Tax=Longispora albida TaxID=203523 RepID=UPI0003A7D718|nr:hypothetical protein [Longispora albida]
MRWKVAFVLGAAAGYILGAKAGRSRYDQIARVARKVRQSPTVQEAAGVVQEQAGKLVHTGKDAVVRAFRHEDHSVGV